MTEFSANATTRLDPIRAHIRARIEALQQELPRLSVVEIGRRADALRKLAQRHGIVPIPQIATSLSDAIAREGRAAIVPAYLQSMLEAVYCDSQEPDAGVRFLAAVSVRLAG